MPFRNIDIGKKIIVDNRQGANWLKKGKELTISAVVSSSGVIFKEYVDKIWACSHDDSWHYASEEKVKIGVRYIVIKGTSSFPTGSPITVKGFMDDDPNKPVAEGLCSGGWLSPSNLTELIELEGLRFKTLHEIVAQYGFNIYENFPFIIPFTDYLGKVVDPARVKQDGRFLHVESPLGKKYQLPPAFFTREDPVEVFAVLKKAGEILNSSAYSESYHKISVDNAGKLLSEIYPIFKDNDIPSLHTLLERGRKTGTVADVGKKQFISHDFIRLLTKEELEQKSNKNEQVIIPF